MRHLIPSLRSEARASGKLFVLAIGLQLAALVAISGCSSTPKRPVLADAQFKERIEADDVEMAKTFQHSIPKVLHRVEERSRAEGPDGPIVNFLALSGGGDYGAFGAGFLVGWGKAPGGRPDFDAVTGVSTGALLAPFAYVGTDEACLTVETFYRNPKKDWTEERGLLYFMPSNPSFMTIPGLTRDLDGVIDAKFVEQMANQSRAGKLLAVSATDLDLGRQRFWEVGVEAEAASASGNLDRVHKILLASAAIPAVFPPMPINDSIYCDGGVTANVFLRLDTRSPRGFLQQWFKTHPNEPLPRVRYWIIVNNQLAHIPKTVQMKWPEVAGPALEVAIRSATISEIRFLAAQADYVNAKYNADVQVMVVAIPDTWRPPVPGDFQQATMDSLADLGRKMGEDPASWMIWAQPEKRTASAEK